MAKAAFYQCHDCKNPFFGGQADCERDLDMAENTKKEEIKCKACNIKTIGGGVHNCPKHGHKHITWKCIYCCSEALFRCGNTHYCKDHHDDIKPKIPEKCDGVNCPLGIPHPPNSSKPMVSMYPLGCSICRQEKNVFLREYQVVVEEDKLDSRQDNYGFQKKYKYEVIKPLCKDLNDNER